MKPIPQMTHVRRAATLLAAAAAIHALPSTNLASPVAVEVYATADTFELASLPTKTHGSAGALNISGTQALNNLNQMKGITDTWIKYDPAPAIAQFNLTFGAGHWVVTSAVLHVNEDPSPNSTAFGIGAGHFSVTWMASDNWTQGTGTSNSPGNATGNKIGFTYGHSILNGGADELLGNAFQNDLVYGYHDFSLAITPGFKADLTAGNPVSLFFTAVDATTGFTFNSSSHSNSHWMILTADVDQSLPCRGDLSGDRQIRGNDIDAYVDGFLNPGGLSPADFDKIDMNDDNILNDSDISCFVAALLTTHNCDATGPFNCP
jgi:hypothetical protein